MSVRRFVRIKTAVFVDRLSARILLALRICTNATLVFSVSGPWLPLVRR